MTPPRYATVTVTWNPDLSVLGRQLASLGGAGLVVVVDNASAEPVAAGLRQLVPGKHVLIAGDTNRGLAAGLNTGARVALERLPGCQFLLFLDQDTEPGQGGADRLVQAAAHMRTADKHSGLVGPLMVDATTGLSHGVHVIRGWQWTRTYPTPADKVGVCCASINGSGMVVAADVFRNLGGFDEALFIDHVDSEYSFRATAAGYRLHTIPAVSFAHRMGERSLRFWFGRWRVWPYRVPQRHYYLFRNAAALMKRPYVPLAWKLAAPVKLLVTAIVHGLGDRARVKQLLAMARGVIAGLRSQGMAVSRRPGLDA